MQKLFDYNTYLELIRLWKILEYNIIIQTFSIRYWVQLPAITRRNTVTLATLNMGSYLPLSKGGQKKKVYLVTFVGNPPDLECGVSISFILEISFMVTIWQRELIAAAKQKKQKPRKPARFLIFNGEPWRIRTSDTLIKSQVLYLLS